MFPDSLAHQKRAKIDKGVAKLGFSWEAMDVGHWTDVDTLASVLEELVQQPGIVFCKLLETACCAIQAWRL